MTLANPIVLAQTAGNRNNIRISGTTMFSGPITVTGTGTGSDVFQNSTNTGQLTLAGNISAPSSFGGSLSFRYGRILITGTINASAATFDLNNGGTTIVSSTGNAWNLIRFAGTSTDNLLQLGADNALATAAPVEFNTTSSGGGIDMNGFDQSLPGFYNTAGSSTAPLSRIFNNGGSDATLTLAGLTANRWSNVALADGTGGGKLALVMNSPGRMQTLASASSSYTGGTTILAGTIALGHESGLGTGTLTVNDGTFDLAGYSPTVGGLSGSSTGLITSGSTGAVATLTVSSDVSSTFAGQIQNGAGTVGLVKSGLGTLTLTGPSTYTGATTVSAGTLALSGGSNRLPTATTLAFAGGTVAMNGVAQTVAGLSVANSMAAAIIGTGSAPSAITSSTGIVLGGGSGTSTLLLQPLSEGAFTVSATPGITINAGGELQLGVYGYTTGTFTNPNANVGASGTGTPVTISGGSLTLTPMRTNAGQTAVGSPNAAYNRVGGLTMSSGLISMSLAVNGDRRLSVYGPLAITGGTVASSASGGTIELFSYANLLSPAAMSNGISISQFMPTTGTSASLTAGVPLTGGLAVRSGVGTFTLTSSVAGQNVGAIQLGDNSATPGAGTTLRLGSNLGLIANAPFPTVHTLNVAPETGGRIDLGIDTSGYTFDLTGNAGQWQPTTTGTLQTSWQLSSTSGTGRFVANGFNFTLSTGSSAARTNVGPNLILESRAGNGVANNLGSGTISSSSVFRYTGSAAAATPSTLVSATSIGDLEVAGSGGLKVMSIGGTVGNVRVSSGRLILGGTSIPSFPSVALTGGTVDLNGYGMTITDLSGSAGGTITSSSSTPVRLTVGGSRSTRFDGTIANAAGSLSLTKTGTGRLTLAGASTYTGLTTVSDGSLVVDGSLASDVSIAAAGSLGGSGSVAAIGGAGLLGPGNSPGILTATSIDPTGGLDFAFEFTQAVPNYASPTSEWQRPALADRRQPLRLSLSSANSVSIYSHAGYRIRIGHADGRVLHGEPWGLHGQHREWTCSSTSYRMPPARHYNGQHYKTLSRLRRVEERVGLHGGRQRRPGDAARRRARAGALPRRHGRAIAAWTLRRRRA
jgi:fibronectin-binding autotransporter adhesin